MKTNKEMLAELDNEQWYDIVDWLFHDYGRGFTSTKGAIIQWLDQHNMLEQYNTWKDIISNLRGM